MTTQGPTMRDVAAEAGVSVMTVSRVLGKKPGVSPQNAKVVWEAVRKLGYRRNELARSLRPGQSSASIGLAVGDVSNPFYGVIAKAVDAVARSAGYFTIMVNTDEDRVREREVIEGLLARRVDGLLLVSADDDHSYLAPDVAAGTGIVFIDRPPRGLEADSVTIDNRGGARDAVADLVARGHRRISFIGDHDFLFTARERRAGYEQAMIRADLGDHFDVHMGTHDIEAAQATAAWLLAGADPPTAIFAGNNLIALGVTRAVTRAAATVDIVGFDDLPNRAELPIGLVSYDVSALATHAVSLLLERLNRPNLPARHFSIPTRIVAPRVRAGSAG